MSDPALVDRIATLSSFAAIPRNELEWLVAHGTLHVYEAGQVVAPKDKRIEYLWIIISGHAAIRVDRGTGPRRVMEWRTGDVSGMLPYSRMSKPPGDSYMEEQSEVLTVHEKHFSEMVSRCPVFTAHTVHRMLDRARNFNASDLQDEKMVSLGKLAAGLAHELNNPASATVRCARILTEMVTSADNAWRVLAGTGLNADAIETIDRLRSACLAESSATPLTPLQRSDRQEEMAEWLASHHADPALAAPLADTAVTTELLDRFTASMSESALDAALHWITASCAMHSLANEIVHAATRVHELVAAVKRFTTMDNLAGPEYVDIQPGLRDTIRMLAPKVKSKGASVTVGIAPDLPRVHMTAGELNQVWMNLIENALDAIRQGGRIEIEARRELERIVIRIVDDGPGIPSDILPKIFDPFFTTKPPGEGTGLGLEITRRLVRRYRGDISIQSAPGRTECRVSLVAEKSSPDRP